MMDLLSESDLYEDDQDDIAPDPLDPVDVKTICPFTVCVDTREQAPYRFLNIDPFSIIPLRTDQPLKTGDYSIMGFESLITIERKSVSDFLGSITAGRDRFEREFERMAEMIKAGGFAAVVVEAELSEILRETASKSQIRVDSIMGTVDAWSIRYGVHFRFCMGRRFAEIQTLKLLHQFYRQEKRKDKDALEKLAKTVTTTV